MAIDNETWKRAHAIAADAHAERAACALPASPVRLDRHACPDSRGVNRHYDVHTEQEKGSRLARLLLH